MPVLHEIRDHPNQCARLVGNAIVFYNSAILSRLLEKYEASGNEPAMALITSTSPVAWQHVHLNGRYAFRDGGQAIDLDTIIQGLKLDDGTATELEVAQSHSDLDVLQART